MSQEKYVIFLTLTIFNNVDLFTIPAVKTMKQSLGSQGFFKIVFSQE